MYSVASRSTTRERPNQKTADDNKTCPAVDTATSYSCRTGFSSVYLPTRLPHTADDDIIVFSRSPISLNIGRYNNVSSLLLFYFLFFLIFDIPSNHFGDQANSTPNRKRIYRKDSPKSVRIPCSPVALALT